jgi:hypothetical protein
MTPRTPLGSFPLVNLFYIFWLTIGNLAPILPPP